MDLHQLWLEATHVDPKPGFIRTVVDAVGHTVLIGVRVRATLRDGNAGLVGTAIVRVEDTVPVVVIVRYAVFVFEAVPVFRLVGSAVIGIEDAVLIVVGIRTAIIVLETIEILGLLGATVISVGQAVLVSVLDARGPYLLGHRVTKHAEKPVVRRPDSAGHASAATQACGEADLVVILRAGKHFERGFLPAPEPGAAEEFSDQCKPVVQ